MHNLQLLLSRKKNARVCSCSCYKPGILPAVSRGLKKGVGERGGILKTFDFFMTIFSLPGGSPIFNRKLPRKISFSLSYALSNAIVLFLFFGGGVGGRVCVTYSRRTSIITHH